MIIGVVVLHFKNKKNTYECLSSLSLCASDKIKIIKILVNNNPHEEIKKQKDTIYIKNTQNYGFSGGMNIGIAEALKHNADAVIILNNDTLLDKDFLKNMAAAFKNADIVSPKIYFAPGYEFHTSRYKKSQTGRVIWYAGGKIDWENVVGIHEGVDKVDEGQFNTWHETDYATGACMMIKREVFKKIGFFDKRYFLYLEDMDFCVRAKMAEFKIIFHPDAVIWHKNAGSSGGSGSLLQDYFITRNRLLFAFKFTKLKTKLAVLKQAILQSNVYVKRRALKDFLFRRLEGGSFIKNI